MSVADLAAVADQHVMHEYVHKDVEATLATMTAEPSILLVPTEVPALCPGIAPPPAAESRFPP